MTGNAKKFLEVVSKDEALKKELIAAKSIDEALKIAKAHGFELTAEDFAPLEMEKLSEDEMKAVAGGSLGSIIAEMEGSECTCHNGGEGFSPTLQCSCTDQGEGLYVGPPIPTLMRLKRCNCGAEGHGSA